MAMGRVTARRRLLWRRCGPLAALLLGVLALLGSDWLGQAPVARGQAGAIPKSFFGLYGGYQDERTMALARESGAGLMRVYVEWSYLRTRRMPTAAGSSRRRRRASRPSSSA
jgi:hypothetical protein